MKKRLELLSVVLLLITVAPNVGAASLDFIFDHYSSEDGLPHNSISDIHQDSKGYIWTCTWSGLSRFDGNSFINYIIRPGDRSNLSHNRILSVDEDANGYLWLTAYDYRLYRFDSADGTFVCIPDDLPSFSDNDLKVKCFLNDKAGNTWIAVSGLGLYRIDSGLGIVKITGAHSVGVDITALYEDSEGRIYTVSETGVSVVRDTVPSLVSRTSGIIGFEESGDCLYFLSDDELMVVDKGLKGHFTVDLASLGAGAATAISSTGEAETLYIGFRDNAIGVVGNDSGTVRLLKNDMGRVRSLFPDSKGLLWIVTERTGIYSYNPDRSRFRHYEHSRNVMSYYVDTLARVSEKDGVTWVKMNNYGFGRYDRDADEIVPLYNVKEQEDCRYMNGVACFEVDKDGVLWFSTVTRGLDRVTVISPKVDVIVPPTASDDVFSASEIRAMLRDRKGNVWVAAKSGELYRYNADMTSCRRFPDRTSGELGTIYTIFEDNVGNIWLGTKWSGLVRMTPEGDGYTYRRFRHDPSCAYSISSDNIYSIEQDADGKLWFGTFGGGLSMLENPDAKDFRTVFNTFTGYPLEFADRIRCVHRMKEGRMLVGTVGGLIWFDPSGQSPEFHPVRKIPGDEHSIGNNDIIYMFSDSRDNTWLCTFGGGLNRLHFENGRPVFDIVSKADGLPSDIVLAAVEDRNGNIWLSTENGISKVDAEDMSVSNYTRYDGIVPTNFSEATCALLDDGSIIFGTMNNIYRVDPSSFEGRNEDIRLVISGLSIDGTRHPLSDEVVVRNGFSYIRIDFASLNFKVRSGLNYSYRLEGYDKAWISGGDVHSVTYSGLKPGKYVFRVKASNMSGGSDGQAVEMKLRVRPSLWWSPVAKMIYLVLAILSLAAIARMLITQVKLRNDVKIEQELNSMKVRFFTNISHELRTPLTLILGGIDEVSRNTPEGDRNEYGVRLVYRNAKRMMTLVNQLLDIRRIVNGKIRLKVKQIDIVDLVKKVYDDFKDMSAERNIEMRIAYSVDSLMVWGDEMRLEALVYNLLSNAFKYTADGGCIEVGLFWRDGEDRFTVMVKDNGIGVPKEKQTAIFEPFVQAADTVLKGMSSSGIGLSFCKEITQMHGGSIWVESHKNEGSAFYVRLPMDRDHFSEETAEFLEENREAEQGEQSFGLNRYRVAPTHPEDAQKVLVVEDNPELRVYIYNNLVNQYKVKDAVNGRDALAVIGEGWIPDIIVTDLMMPEMDGIELINRIRNDFSVSHIPVIIFTAKSENDTHLKAMKYGADGYITKPFTMELLIARIENIFERRKMMLGHLTEARESGGGTADKKIDISPEEIVITDRDEELIRKVMQWLEENVSDADVTVDQLAVYVGMGRTSMYNKVKGLTGKSPVELIQEFRLKKALFYLKSGQFSVSETSYKVGFSDPGYFSRSFKKHFGVSPAEYMKQNA